jgi:hypothetical protein
MTQEDIMTTLTCDQCKRQIRPADRYLNWSGVHIACQPCTLQGGMTLKDFERQCSVAAGPHADCLRVHRIYPSMYADCPNR